MTRMLLAVSTSVLALAHGGLAFAQEVGAPPAEPTTAQTEPEPVSVDDIVVTALKRSESVQRVPAAVNVVTLEQIANSGATKLEDIARVSPSLTVTPAAGNIHSTIAIRGVFSNNLSPGVAASVGIVIDDIAQPAEAQGYNELGDIERIEVLRGPQSTVTGRNASAGLLNIVTRAPSDVFGADVEASATSDHEVRLKGFVTGPLAEGLAGSLAAYYNDYRGNAYNAARDDHLGREAFGTRGKLRWRPTDALDVTLSAFYQKLDESQVNPIYQYFGPNARRLGRPISEAVGPGDFNYANSDTYSPVSAFQNSESKAVNLRVGYSLGDYQLLSISGYQQEHIEQLSDVLGTTALGYPSPAFTGGQAVDVSTQTLSQEFRLLSPAENRFNYVLGLYVLDTSVRFDFTRLVVAPFNRLRKPSNTNYAAYVRANYDVTDKLRVIGGLRFNREELDYQLYDRILAAGSANSTSDDVFTGEAIAQYQIDPSKMVFARYARGYQGKAFDLDAPLVVGTPYQPLDPETVDSFEAGAKLQFLDRRLTLNATAFHATYKDYQAQSGLITPTVLIFQLLNAGTVKTKGVELETAFQATDDLRFNLSATYTDAEIESFANAPCYAGQTAATGCVTAGGSSTQNLDGKPLSNTPEWRATGGVEYRLPLDLPFEVSLRGDVRWQTATNFDLLGNPFTVQDDYAIANLSARFVSPDERYQMTVFVNNVTDEQYFTQLSDNRGFFGDTALTTRGLPRDFRRYVGVRFNVRY